MAGKSLDELERELRRSEQEQLVAEESLGSEGRRLDDILQGANETRERIRRDVQSALGLAPEPSLLGPQLKRLERLVLPPLDAQPYRVAQQDARRQAVEARRKVAEAYKLALRAHNANVTKLEQYLAAERAALEVEQSRLGLFATPPAKPTVALKVEMMLPLTGETNLFVGGSRVLREGGVFVPTAQAVPVGAPVELSLILPEGQRVAARGEVRWVRAPSVQSPELFPGFGVRFLELLGDAEAELSRFAVLRAPFFVPDREGD